MDLFAVGIGAASAALTYLVMPFAIMYLERREILDIPVERSSHSTVTIRGGGIAMVGPLILGVLAARGLPWATVLVNTLSLLALAAIGFRDDEDGLGAAPRFSLVFAIALVSGCAVLGISWEAAFGAFLLLAFVNAFNFMDGINGISGFTMLISGLAYGVIGSIEESQALAGVGFAIAGAGLGFLPFNFPSARVFMGDVGSYLAGGAIAISAMVAIDAGVPFLLAMSPLALYAVDTSTTLGRRILRGERFSEAHREHVYQRVAEKKGHVGGTILVAAASVPMIAAAFFGSRFGWAPAVVVVVMLIPAGCYLLAPNVLTKVGRNA